MWENKGEDLRRQAVPGGWLYLVSRGACESMCFVPNPPLQPVYPGPHNPFPTTGFSNSHGVG